MVPVREVLTQTILERVYLLLAVVSLGLALTSMGYIQTGPWILACICYTATTVFRLLAGTTMNRMGDAAAINAWNNKYHRLVVIGLNSGVGAALLGRLAYDWFMLHIHEEALVFLATALVAYFIAARFTRPNTFGARVRSVTLTVVLIGTMAYLTWPEQWGLWMLASVIMLNIAVLHLCRLQRRFGWEMR